MNNLNNVVLEGRLVRDAQDGYHQSEKGVAWGTFTIAVNRSVKVNEEWKDEVSYIDCKGFGKRYDYAVPKMKKGTLVVVVGKLLQERWTGKDGQTKSKFVVEVDEYHAGPSVSQQTEPQEQRPQPQNPPPAPSAEADYGFPEDIPF